MIPLVATTRTLALLKLQIYNKPMVDNETPKGLFNMAVVACCPSPE
jgi:hypothetical protein